MLLSYKLLRLPLTYSVFSVCFMVQINDFKIGYNYSQLNVKIKQRHRSCLVPVFENYFLFSKKKKKDQENIFVSPCFFVMKNLENTKNTYLNKKEQLSENNKMIFLRVFKNCFQEEFLEKGTKQPHSF